MSVKENSVYEHYKGNLYVLISISLPIQNMPQTEIFGRSRAFHTELEEEIDIFKVDDAIYNETDEFLVIYKNVNEPKIFARPVDMFFGYVQKDDENFLRKRFSLQEGSEA